MKKKNIKKEAEISENQEVPQHFPWNLSGQLELFPHLLISWDAAGSEEGADEAVEAVAALDFTHAASSTFN